MSFHLSSSLCASDKLPVETVMFHFVSGLFQGFLSTFCFQQLDCHVPMHDFFYSYSSHFKFIELPEHINSCLSPNFGSFGHYFLLCSPSLSSNFLFFIPYGRIILSSIIIMLAALQSLALCVLSNFGLGSGHCECCVKP